MAKEIKRNRLPPIHRFDVMSAQWMLMDQEEADALRSFLADRFDCGFQAQKGRKSEKGQRDHVEVWCRGNDGQTFSNEFVQEVRKAAESWRAGWKDGWKNAEDYGAVRLS